MRRFCLLIFVLLVVFFIPGTPVFAQDFKNDYQVEYFLTENGTTVTSRVKFTITITNLSSELYVKQFSLSFPNSFEIEAIKAYDDRGAIIPKVEMGDRLRKITMAFSDPEVGRGSVNNFYLEFYQKNLFVSTGNIWEVIIPTIENKGSTNYKIIVHLPLKSGKKLSIAKPKPDTINGSDITWNNPKTKTIYAVFGDRQYYDVNLSYHIDNSKLVPVYTDIAFPPDTLYQKTYVKSIDPPPSEILMDQDNNFLGRYVLKPREQKKIVFKGAVAVFANPQDQLIDFERRKKLYQRASLLAEKSYWKLSDTSSIAAIQKNPEDIYRFVVSTLSYNYDKVATDNKRLGAQQALVTPDNAVCMEFTDLFVAIGRNKGLIAREIEGYGITQDPRLRPLSSQSDILHSWPEFLDEKTGFWRPIDPTWEDTSGIDYFSDFDLNHLVFAIHGEDPAYPPPAGAYKIGDSKDVVVTATTTLPDELIRVSFGALSIPKSINDRTTYKFTLDVKNEGNTFIWDPPLKIEARNLTFTPQELDMAPLAPGQSKKIAVSFTSRVKNKKDTGYVRIALPKQKPFEATVEITPFYYQVGINLSIGLFISAVLLFLLFTLRGRIRPKRPRKKV